MKHQHIWDAWRVGEDHDDARVRKAGELLAAAIRHAREGSYELAIWCLEHATNLYHTMTNGERRERCRVMLFAVTDAVRLAAAVADGVK